MTSNYPPGTSASDPRAPWNETDGLDVDRAIEEMDGQAFYESGNHDIDGSLDCFNGRIDFLTGASSRPWAHLLPEERALFDQYAEVVRGFAHLYERGEA